VLSTGEKISLLDDLSTIGCLKLHSILFATMILNTNIFSALENSNSKEEQRDFLDYKLML
jgi:hypothetical protein